MQRVFRVHTDITVEADDAEAARESVADFWQRASVASAHVTRRGVLTALRAEAATETFEEPVYTRRELVALMGVAAQVALVVVDVLT